MQSEAQKSSPSSRPTLSVSLCKQDADIAIAIERRPVIPALSALLPALHNMGLSVERQEHQTNSDTGSPRSRLWLDSASSARLAQLGSPAAFADFLGRLFSLEAEDGRLNGLAVIAELNAHEILLVRAYASYLRQAGWHMSLRYMADCLRRQPAAVREWLAYHNARLDPSADRVINAEAIALTQLQRTIAALTDVDAAELLEKLRQLVGATLRSNYFQHHHTDPLPDYLAIKLDAQALEFLPKPRPYREIFVFSERFEGVHLRGGPVSRGGLRWSDRREDYRTEVLGLVKAQLVKNAVIVPTGAKGGFVCKLLPHEAPRERIAQEGVEVYQLFINALLDLTDNYVDGRVQHPANVARHDGDDPYLVVAADKGTASFSDVANAISLERGFWLGDAFASGGSNGYDHKKLGITAKGAWETAKIRFTETGIDWTRDSFTVVGIGDMSGDVFGNGMLLMPRLQLIAAFDHRHIFIDPKPDTARAYAERQRLFALPRSSWDDYDRSLISSGGGIWSRAERSIPLTEEVRAALGINDTQLSPDALIRAILATQVDVIYNGGIGTYFKAAGETHEQVRDRANDRVRLDASEVRGRVVVEGGNLGLTQSARIELAAQGVLVLTDAVDNSAGVDCSDHEVNLKILLQQAGMATGATSDLLARMAPAVEQAVLATNRAQARRLMRHRHVPGLIADPAALLRSLEASAGLDRALEKLPTDAVLATRDAGRLYDPELAVVLAHAKMAIKSAWLAAKPAVMPWHSYFLQRYFPADVRELGIDRHPLAAEIIATRLANELVDRAGIHFAHDVTTRSQASLVQVIDAFAFAYAAQDLDAWLQQHDHLLTTLPRAERHAIDAALEQGLAAAVDALLAVPESCSAASWQALCPALGAMSNVTPTSSALAEQLLAHSRRFATLAAAQPLIAQGHAATRVLVVLRQVSEQTSPGNLAMVLNQAGQPGAAQWALKMMDRINLLLAARVLAQADASDVDATVQQLGWRNALDTLHALCVAASTGGAVQLSGILGAVGRLDDMRHQQELQYYGRA